MLSQRRGSVDGGGLLVAACSWIGADQWDEERQTPELRQAISLPGDFSSHLLLHVRLSSLHDSDLFTRCPGSRYKLDTWIREAGF